MKSTPERPPFRPSTQGYHREDVDTFIRATADERAQLQERVADLEAVLDATIQVLQARLAKRPASVTPTATNAHPLNPSHRLAFVLVPLIVATAAIPGVWYLRMPLLNFVTRGHSTIVHKSANQVATPVVRTEQQRVESSGTAPDMRPEPPPPAPAGPVEPQPSREGLTISVDARNPCWIGVTLDGQRKLERLLRRGETTILHARDEVVLKAGNAGALSLTINGLAAAPLGRRGQTVTTRITMANYKRLVEPAPQPGRAGG